MSGTIVVEDGVPEERGYCDEREEATRQEETRLDALVTHRAGSAVSRARCEYGFL